MCTARTLDISSIKKMSHAHLLEHGGSSPHVAEINNGFTAGPITTATRTLEVSGVSWCGGDVMCTLAVRYLCVHLSGYVRIFMDETYFVKNVAAAPYLTRARLSPKKVAITVSAAHRR